MTHIHHLWLPEVLKKAQHTIKTFRQDGARVAFCKISFWMTNDTNTKTVKEVKRLLLLKPLRLMTMQANVVTMTFIETLGLIDKTFLFFNLFSSAMRCSIFSQGMKFHHIDNSFSHFWAKCMFVYEQKNVICPWWYDVP